MNTKHEQEKDLKSAVVDRISKEGITPRGKTYWLLLDVMVWGLWLLAVLLGALAVAVLLFASLQMSFELYEVTHDSTTEFIMEWLPVLWIIVLAVMSAVAYFNMRHTKRGYKYPLSIIVLSSVGASIVGGFILHFVGVGYYVDTYLGRAMPMYHSQEVMSARNWQRPEEGRLVGRFEGEFENIEMLRFEDLNGEVWQVKIADLRPMDMRLVHSGETVRVIGMVATGTERMIHSCGVFPWLLDKPPALGELQEQRQMFMAKLKEENREDKSKKEVDDETKIEKLASKTCHSWLRQFQSRLSQQTILLERCLRYSTRCQK